MSGSSAWFISAGEHSGDLLARDLVKYALSKNPEISFFGVGGSEMCGQGVDIVVPLDSLNVMGLFEILSKLADIVEIEQRILDEVVKRRPEVCILVDFPGFHFRLAKRLRSRGFKVVQYVAPKVWAWGESRVKNLREDFDLVLGVLPFETSFFEQHRVNYEYVGSPHIDRIDKAAAVAKSFAGVGVDGKSRYIGVLPGSRTSEVRRVAPEILGILHELKSLTEIQFKFVVPVAPSLQLQTVLEAFEVSEIISNGLPSSSDFTNPIEAKDFIFVPGKSLEVMQMSEMVLVTSGTATLECALLNTPLIVLYKMNYLSYLIAKFKLQVKWISLVNLSLNESLVSEYIQNIDPHMVAKEVLSLVKGGEKRSHQMAGFMRMRERYFGFAEDRAFERIMSLVHSSS